MNGMSHPESDGSLDLRPIMVGEIWENPVTREYATILEVPWHNQESRAVAELRYDLERLKIPTLLIAAEDNQCKSLLYANYSSGHIPKAQLLSFPTGGHILVGHPETFEAIAKFLLR